MSSFWFLFWILIFIFDFWLWFLIFQVQFTLVISIWSDELCQMELYVPCLNYLRPEWLTDTTWPWIPMTMFYTFLMPNPIGLFDYWTWSILLTLILITKLLLEVESGVCQVSNYYWFYILFKNSELKWQKQWPEMVVKRSFRNSLKSHFSWFSDQNFLQNSWKIRCSSAFCFKSAEVSCTKNVSHTHASRILIISLKNSVVIW